MSAKYKFKIGIVTFTKEKAEQYAAKWHLPSNAWYHIPITDKITGRRAEGFVFDAVDHELSTLHMVASDDPQESIRRLIDWHCAVQIDPLVSSAAQELIERGRREVLEQPEKEPVEKQRDELLDALRECLPYVRETLLNTGSMDAYHTETKASVAIAKAEGKV